MSSRLILSVRVVTDLDVYSHHYQQSFLDPNPPDIQWEVACYHRRTGRSLCIPQGVAISVKQHQNTRNPTGASPKVSSLNAKKVREGSVAACSFACRDPVTSNVTCHSRGVSSFPTSDVVQSTTFLTARYEED